jgi:uncharacterized Zn finger protein
MWETYERLSPIPVKGGIKAQTKRGKFSLSWWGNRWIDALESFDDSGRLSRGRSYARKGQVLSIHIQSGEIHAKVQGSRPVPYLVEIWLKPLSEKAWELIIDNLCQKALYTARLLTGELPSEIEEIFNEVNAPLFPTHHTHLDTDCSCPDWSNPCKHVAAVLYLLAEEFDRDPFLLFKVRGMDKESFLSRLEKSSLLFAPENLTPPIEEECVPLTDDPALFWEGTPLPENWLQGAFERPHQDTSLIKGLGKFPFWRGENPLQETLESIYGHASKTTSDYSQTS